ncbi:MAG: hypothetical protein WKF53_13390 [Rubrobacter sp.]
MVRVSVEVREGDAPFEMAMYADSISQAVGIARDRFPGHDVRVVFPIDGEEFFGEVGTEGDDMEYGSQPKLLPDRVL